MPEHLSANGDEKGDALDTTLILPSFVVALSHKAKRSKKKCGQSGIGIEGFMLGLCNTEQQQRFAKVYA